jgi:hypothetical protein
MMVHDANYFSQPVTMQHRSRGPRPRYFSDAQLDRFHLMLVALVQEVAVLRDRVDAFERLAEENGAVSREALDNYLADEVAHGERREWREAYIERVMRVVFEEAEQLRDARGERFTTIEDVVASVST